ncbi:mitochondrial small ribosomal subunit Rsm22-domain-containing protein [Astrocystis sublimbata]|nr:mitochondrial small ribosomal subunit Rsm22-domain-containing protein [Astrocystis sublimbata]
MSGITNIASSGEWQRILSSTTVVITDFYADWCGPCKMIAPTFESLATKYAKPGRIAFCKVNVDNHQSIAQQHGVSAMPTFLVFKNGSVADTIRGANPPALTAAVEKAVKSAGVTAPGASFAMPGRTLGGSGGSGNTAPGRRAGGNTLGGGRSWSSFSLFHFFNALLTFFGLYFVSLLSFDPYKAAERSDFNLHKPRPQAAPARAGGSGKPPGGASASGRPAGAAKVPRPCPQCRRQVLRLFEKTFAQPEVSALVRRRPSPHANVNATSMPSTIGPSSRAFTTSRPRLQESQSQSQPEPSAPEPEAPKPDGTDDIETIVRQTRRTFGDTLPKGYLSDDEYKVYVRLYGPPLRETTPADVGMPIPPEETEQEDYEYDSSEKVVLRETEDGSFEEIVYEKEESAQSTAASTAEEIQDSAIEVPEGTFNLEDLPSEAGLAHINAVAKNEREFNALLRLQKDFEAALVQQSEKDMQEDNQEEVKEDEEPEEDEEEVDEEDEADPDAVFGDPADRAHAYTRMGEWRTYPTTLHLPKADFVTPIADLLARTDIKHVTEAAEKTFGGPALPFSVATPSTRRNAEQKPITLSASHHKMSEIEADVFIATLLPAMYSSTMSILVEIRKRLGPNWMANLMDRANGTGPRVLDVGTGGAALVAWEQVLRAEWALAKGEGRGENRKDFHPPGKKTAVVGSEQLRQRVSRFLHNTTFLPRLPDYLHSGDHPDKLEGGEASLPRKQFDVIIASHQMMPLKDNFRRKAMLDNLWEMLSPDGGVLIVLEKGHPRGFEAVADVRSRLLNEFIVTPTSDPRPEAIELESTRDREEGRIIAPCTNHKACPMYLTPGLTHGRKDFCHFSQRFIRPPFLQKILGATSRDHEDVDFSFVAIQRGSQPPSPFTNPESPTLTKIALELEAMLSSTSDTGRNLTESAFAGFENAPTAPDPFSLPRNLLPPIKRQGHVTFDMCTPAGTIERWTVPKSYSKQAYRDARKARWGDLWALGAKTRVPRVVRLGKGGVAPNDGGVRAQAAARAGKTRVITLDANDGGIYGAREGGDGKGEGKGKGKGKEGKEERRARYVCHVDM